MVGIAPSEEMYEEWANHVRKFQADVAASGIDSVSWKQLELLFREFTMKDEG